MDLHERIGGKPTPLTDDGIVLTEKLAKTLGAAAGDTVTLKNADGDAAEVTVTGVGEHDIHYARRVHRRLRQGTDVQCGLEHAHR